MMQSTIRQSNKQADFCGTRLGFQGVLLFGLSAFASAWVTTSSVRPPSARSPCAWSTNSVTSSCPRKSVISLHSISPSDRSDVLAPNNFLNSHLDSTVPLAPLGPRYDLGLGKNKPKQDTEVEEIKEAARESLPSHNAVAATAPLAAQNWMVPESVIKPTSLRTNTSGVLQSASAPLTERPVTYRRMVARDNDAQLLRGALWDERHYEGFNGDSDEAVAVPTPPVRASGSSTTYYDTNAPPYPKAFYPDIDLSIPDSVYSDDGSVDLVWDLMRWEVYQNQQEQYEPLLVSFLHSSILNHATLESSLAFLLANRLQSPAMMISTQLQALILSALHDCPTFRRKVRADIMAVRDRDPACHTLPDVFLYFKGFHALQSHRAAHVLWNTQRTVLAQYLQSQVSQIFQIDIHPNATIGSGIMLDHGTGIVIGETATVGHNCSILHHVTLGGSGKKGVVRHPAVGNGVLLGAGATVLGPVTIGDGSQVGAGTLVISDLPSHSVAVGVPARIIGSFVDVTEQPSIGMNQILERQGNMVTFESEGI